MTMSKWLEIISAPASKNLTGESPVNTKNRHVSQKVDKWS
jgi:hypothetical protein